MFEKAWDVAQNLLWDVYRTDIGKGNEHAGSERKHGKWTRWGVKDII